MRLSFHVSEERNGSHDSPFGSFFLSTKTKQLIHHEEENSLDGRFSLIYDLSMQGSLAGQYEMHIDYKEDTVNS